MESGRKKRAIVRIEIRYTAQIIRRILIFRISNDSRQNKVKKAEDPVSG
jgi:hypothetical protein